MKTNNNKQRLKTYKIKNHDSGKTYSVKAVNYTDAKKKYNAHISDELQLVETIGDYTIKKNNDDFLKFAVFYKGQIIAETTTVAIAKKEINSHKNDTTKDSLTEDALSKFVQSYLGAKKVSSKAEQDEIIQFLLERNKITTEDIPKVRSLLKIVKDAVTEDSYSLKTYKIKNTDSGKTYRVKATSYTDAKDKYSKHILKDSWTNVYKQFEALVDKHFPNTKAINEAVEALYKQHKGQADWDEAYKRWQSTTNDSFTEDNSFNALRQFRKELKEISFKSDEQTIRSVFLKAETIARQVESSIKGLSREHKTKLANLKKDPNNNTAKTAFYAVDGLVSIIKNTLIDCAQFFETRGGGIIRALSVWSNGRIVGQRFEGRTDKYLSMAKKYHDRFLRLYQQLERTLKDSITEDAVIYGEWESSKKNGMWYVNTNDLQKTKRELKSAGYKYESHSTNLEGMMYKYTVQYTKDSLTEDAEISVGKTYTSKSGHKLTVKNVYVGFSDYDGSAIVRINYSYEKTDGKKGNGIAYTEDFHKMLNDSTNDSWTEDADIAQTDIKSTYLPEDANADNIQYLGFNEKRKLSFYGYGDRYFVHYDLEGRTEEVDKETVQKILKKNILGEIDENDLINKEPQSEEIVSDDFDWEKKQERGER